MLDMKSYFHNHWYLTAHSLTLFYSFIINILKESVSSRVFFFYNKAEVKLTLCIFFVKPSSDVVYFVLNRADGQTEQLTSAEAWTLEEV